MDYRVQIAANAMILLNLILKGTRRMNGLNDILVLQIKCRHFRPNGFLKHALRLATKNSAINI